MPIDGSIGQNGVCHTVVVSHVFNKYRPALLANPASPHRLQQIDSMSAQAMAALTLAAAPSKRAAQPQSKSRTTAAALPSNAGVAEEAQTPCACFVAARARARVRLQQRRGPGAGGRIREMRDSCVVNLDPRAARPWPGMCRPQRSSNRLEISPRQELERCRWTRARLGKESVVATGAMIGAAPTLRASLGRLAT